MYVNKAKMPTPFYLKLTKTKFSHLIILLKFDISW